MGARSFWILALLAVAGLGLAAAVVAQGLSAAGVGRLGPAVQIRQAAALLPQAASEADYRAVEARAREALARAPMEARAVSLMALARERRGRPAEGRRLIEAAATLSHRDTVADLWLFDEAVEQGRYGEALARADALLRRDVTAHQPVMGVIVAVAGDPAVLGPLAARLAARPPWREHFFYTALQNPLPPFVYPLFEALQAAGSPPTADEMTLFLRRLTEARAYEQAYLAWLLSLSSDELRNLSYVHDGGFDGRSTIAPFGWVFTGGAGGSAVIEAAPDGGRALLVHSNGYSAGVLANQLVVLPPGRYRLSGKVQAPPDAQAGRLAWTLTCRDGRPAAPLLRRAAEPTGGQWRRFAADFTVPQSGCPAQMLTLAASAADRRTATTVWYDDVAIEPAAGGALAETAP